MATTPNFSQEEFDKLKQAAEDLGKSVDFMNMSLEEYMRNLEKSTGSFPNAVKSAKSLLQQYNKEIKEDSKLAFSEIERLAGKSASLMASSFTKSTTYIGSQFTRLGASISINNKKIRSSMVDVFKGGGTGFGALKAGSKEFANQLSTGLASSNNQINMLVKGGERLFEIFKKMDTSASNLARSLNITYEEAAKVRTALRDSSLASGELSATGESLSKSMIEMNNQLGTSARFNNERLIQYTKLRDVAKFEPEILEDVNRISLASNQTLEQTTKNRLAQINLSKIQLGRQVDEKKVMQDISKASYNIKLNFLGRDKDLARAATQARALGMELSQTEKIAEGLMDFENSITKQMEAEVLTGQTLNLERARYYALTNDISGLQSELNAQGITAEKFGKMNRIQQSAIAEAMGMSKEEMSKMLVEQKALKNLGVGSLSDAQKQYELAVKNGTVDQFTAKLGDESLERQFRQQSLQDRMNMALEKMLSVFEKLAVVFAPIYKMFVGVAEFLGKSEAILKSILFLVTAIAAKKLYNIGAGLFSKGPQLGAPASIASQLAKPAAAAIPAAASGLAANQSFSVASGISRGTSPMTPAAGVAGSSIVGPAATTAATTGATAATTTAAVGGSAIAAGTGTKAANAISRMKTAGKGITAATAPAAATVAAPASISSQLVKPAAATNPSFMTKLGTSVGQKGWWNTIKGGASSLGTNIMTGAKGLLGKINPITALKTAANNAGGWGKLFGGALSKGLKGSALNSVISTLFAIQDFQNLMENPVDDKGELLSKKALSEKAGKIVFSTGGSIIGGIVGAGIGGPIASIVGSLGGQWLMGKIADNWPEGAGWVGEKFVPQEKLDAAPPPSLYEGGVVEKGGLINAHAGEVYTGGGTLQIFQGMWQELKTQNAQLMEQNKHLVALVNKNTVLKLDGQVLAQSSTRTAATQYGNLLNGTSYV